MSVIQGLFRRSKLEVINQAEAIQEDILEVCQNDFYVASQNYELRSKFSYGKVNTDENIRKRASMLELAKTRTIDWSDRALADLRAANAIFVKTSSELELRRTHQSKAIANYTKVLSELDSINRIFEIKDGCFTELVSSIRKEMDLIKKWRQKDSQNFRT